MNYYQIVIIEAFVLGQIFFGLVCAWYLQLDKPELNYFDALRVFIKKEIGGFLVSVSFLSLVVFVLSDFINLNLTKQDLMLKQNRTNLENAQLYFRTVASFLGVFAQWLAFYVFKRGKKGIEDASKKAGI